MPCRTVVFSGGRGAGALIERLLADRRVEVSIVINGYDDGASTGEVRRFLGDALGPSDFRKNAGRAARALATATDALIDLLDCRLPAPCPPDLAEQLADVIASGAGPAAAPRSSRCRAGWTRPIAPASSAPSRPSRRSAVAAAARSRSPIAPSATSSSPGLYLLAARDFNGAVRAYTAMLGLPDGLIENVTDGTNAHLAALDAGGALLSTEAAIVDAPAAQPRSDRSSCSTGNRRRISRAGRARRSTSGSRRTPPRRS